MSPTPRRSHLHSGIDSVGEADGQAGYGGIHCSTVIRSAGWAPMYETRDELGGAGWIEPNSHINHTGTTIVAVTTDEATILGADRRASLGGRFVSNKDIDKIRQVHPTAALALSGAVSHLQQVTDFLRAEASLYEMRRGEPMSLPALSTLLANVLRGASLLVTPILGGVDADGPRVVTLDPGGGMMEDRYAAAGSGMQLAYGVLEQGYETGLPRAEACSLVARSIDAASERDTASGNGLTLASVTTDGIEINSHASTSEVG